MKIIKDTADWFQYWLVVYLPVDSPTPNYLASGEEDISHWQFVVDSIYMLIKSGLIDVEPPDYLIRSDEISCDGVEGFCSALASQNPYKLDELHDPPAAWISPYITITDKCIEVIRKNFGLDFLNNPCYNLNENFINDLIFIFKKNGFNERDFPLFPVG